MSTCTHKTRADHIEAELAEWPQMQRDAFRILISSLACQYALEHWDEWMAEATFEAETMALLDKDWFAEHIVTSQAEAGSMLAVLHDMGGVMDVSVEVV